MEISNSVAPPSPAVGVAIQKLVLDSTKADGAGLVQLLASVPVASANSPAQGHFVDSRV